MNKYTVKCTECGHKEPVEAVGVLIFGGKCCGKPMKITKLRSKHAVKPKKQP